MKTDSIAGGWSQAGIASRTEHANVHIRLYHEQDNIQWDRYVMKSEEASCYHLISWKDIIERSFGHQTYYILAEDGERRVQGILPLVRLKSLFFGHFMVSLPFFNSGGICADRSEVRDRLFQEAAHIARQEGAEHVELRHSYPVEGLQAKTAKVSMRLSLTQDPEKLWNVFPSKLRSQVQRPVKEGMFANIGGEEALDDFYRIFSINMRDLGTPVYPKQFFRNILKAFPSTTWICTVYTRDREPAAAGFLVGFKDTLEIPWASSLRSHNKYSPNMLLYWTVLRFACEKGYNNFDFGRSTPGEGTYRFKEQWGAQPVQLYWHYWLKSGDRMPELNPRNPKYRMAISLWKKLPVGVTRMIGPSIVKNLP